MRVIPRENPVDYRLCNQTVTVYHRNGDGDYSTQVFDNAFFDWKKTQNVDRTGAREANGFLLVIPCSVNPLHVGDKVLRGAGAAITTREAWAALIPSKIPGLGVIQSVDEKYWRDRLVHVEAGGS